MTTIIACGLLVLPSCHIPELQRAECGPVLPDTFDGTASEENSSQLAWCEFFDDPVLTDLISQALVGNQELKILAQEIQVANNEVLSRQGEYLPFVTFGADAGLEKSSLFSHWGAVEDQLEAPPGQPFPDPLPDFLVAANVSWEVDIWRKLRNAKDAAALRYLGTSEGRNYVTTRVVAEVAEKYYELLALDNRLVALQTTIEIQERSLEMIQAMKEAARVTELPVQRFEAEVRKNQSERLIIQQEIIEAENRINFLVGRFPQPVERPSVEFIDLNLRALSIGVPSQLLQNRTDIRQAERQLEAAELDVRVARARFYPSLDLVAGAGYNAINTKYLFVTPEAFIYNVAGELTAPLINKKAIQADYLSANAMQLQAVYNYQRTVLNAFTEVINYMAKVRNYGRSIEVKRQQLASLEASVTNATKLFQRGRVEYLEVLLAQRELMDAKMVLIETKQQQLAAIVNAYQALGGGMLPDEFQLCGCDCSPAEGEIIFLEEPLQPTPENELLPPPAPQAAPPSDLPLPDAESPAPVPGDSQAFDDGRLRALPPVEPLASAGSLPGIRSAWPNP